MKAHSSVELCVHTFLHTSTEGQTHLSILMVMQSSHGNRTCQSIHSMPSGGSRQTLSIHGRCESEQNLRFSRGQHSEKQECDSDDSLKWEEFFGTTVDISSSLLNMYDCLVGKSNDWDGGDTNEEDGSTDACQLSRCDHHNSCSIPRTRFPFRKSLSVNDSCAKRPLSTSSVSSSSSSSSLPRSGIDVKRSYLASIESLADISPDKDSNCSHDQNSHYNQSNGQGVANPESCGQQAVNLEVSGQGSGDLETSGQEKVTAKTSQEVMVSCHQQISDLNLCPTNRVILEIVDTERTYVNDLQEIIEGYFQYLSTEDNKISKFTLRELSGNIEDIYKFNRNFLKELENCGLDPVEVSRCFVKNSTGFAIYTQYCTNYPRSVEVLTKLMQNSQTAEIFRERQLALRHRLPLGSYLLKPVQRITKYQLLLTNLVKHLDKDGDGYPDIKNAISVMTGLVFHINDMKRRHEDAVRVQEIQSLLYEWEGQDLTTYGELAAEGTFRMLGAKASRHLFLFDKILLIAKKKEEGKLSYKDHIMCSNLMLIESIQGEPLCFHVIPFNNPRLQYTFQARNLEQKREWCLELKRVILENYNAVIPSKARQLVMELGQSKEEASVPSDKNSSKRHLSAPEYLEKRKQERRKSEISLNKAFKLKKGNKKNDSMLSPKGSPAENRRGRKSRSASHDATAFLSVPTHNFHSEERQPSFDIACSPIQRNEFCYDRPNKANMTKNNAEDSDCAFVRKRSMSLFPPSIHKPDEGTTNDTDNESISSHIPDVQKENTNRRRYWKAWNSLPDEATDNEMEDNYERIDINRILQLCPPLRPARTEEEILEDLAGEYVTFVFAHQYACRDLDNSKQKWSSLPVTPHICENALADPLNQSTVLTRNRRLSISNSASSSSLSTSMASPCDQNCKKHGNYDNLMNLWNKLGTVEIKTDNSEETGSISSESSWKQNAALRRVQSFTGIAKAKVASLHQSLSFRQQSTNSSGLPPKPKIVPWPKNKRKDYEEIILFSIPPPPVSHSKENSSPTTPAVWLKQQQNHLVESSSKCGSLPSGFHLAHGNNDMGPKKSTSHLDIEKGRMSVKTSHNLYSDHRPFTNASDKPLCDFMEDLEEYIASASYRKQHDFRFPVNSEDRLATCATTPAASMENMSIHPEHKVYRQVGSRYATLRTVISNFSSKISFFKANFGSPMTDQSDNKSMMSNISDSPPRLESMDEHPVCCSTAKSDQESDTKVLKARFGNSIARAYSTMRKQRLSKDEETRESKSIPNDCISKKNSVYVHKSGSSVIGARIAGIHESEYCVPSSLFVCRQLRSNKDEDVRPDSLLSDSSNTTSSSDGDKFSGGSYMNAPFESLLSLSDNITQKDRMEKDISSENNESYEETFYERSFEATECTMPEDLFRDSAIYSDPEDADLSTTESSSVTNYEASPTLCVFPEINITSKDVFDSEKIETKKLSFLDASGSESKNQNVSKIHCTKKLHPADTITSEDLNQSSEKIVRKKNMNCSETIPKNTLNIEPHPIEIVCTRSVNGTTLEKLKILGEENPKLHKEITSSPTNGLKNTEHKQEEIIKLQKEFVPQLVETANVKNQVKRPSLVDGLKSIHQRQNEDIKFLNKLTPLSVDMKNTPEEIKSQIELTPIFNHGLENICQKQNEDIRIQKELNESLVDGLKSIHQRRLELEKWCTRRVNQESKESSSTHSNPCFKIITENGVKEVSTALSFTEPADTQPMPTKGWVKHIVSKFQSES